MIGNIGKVVSKIEVSKGSRLPDQINMESKRISKIVVNAKKNRIVITMTGYICEKEMEMIYRDLIVGVPKLEPGFDVLMDLTECRLAHISGVPIFKEMMEFLLGRHVERVVGVIGNSRLIYNQLSKIADNIKGYSPIYVSTLKEAEELLSSESDSFKFS